MKFTMLLTIMVPALLAAGAPSVSRNARSYPANVQEASALLENLRADAVQINEDAEQLRLSALENTADWETHTAELVSIKDQIGDMGHKLDNLSAIQGAAMPWQRRAFQQALPVVQAMANDAASAIGYVAANPHYLFSPEYLSYQSKLSDESTALGSLLRNYQDQAKARTKDVQLSQAARVSKVY
jgi:hypothetical protein